MAPAQYPLSSRLRYRFDNFMSRGGLAVFSALMLMFVCAIAVVAILRFVANLIAPQESTADIAYQWWLSFLQVADGGAIGEDTQSNAVNRVVGVFALFLGLVLFSSLVAFITSQFEQMLTSMRKGKSAVIEQDHTLILGFGERVLEIIRELLVANESEKDAAVVVLAPNEKDEMDDFFHERIEDPKTTRIITRSGSTSSLQLLRRVGVSTAKSVVILNDAPKDSSDEDKAKGDAMVLKTILAVLSCVDGEKAPSIVAELHLASKQQLACSLSPKVAVIDENAMLAKLMVQTSRVSGLALVYDRLVGFDGCEFYFHRPAQGWGGASYGQISMRYHTCCALGLRRADGSLAINPPPNTIAADNDDVILLAEDDSAIAYSTQPFPAVTPNTPPAAPLAKQIERELLVGWSLKSKIMIEEYSKYLTEGSSIDVITPHADFEMHREFAAINERYPGVAMRLIEDSVDDPEVMRDLHPERYDNVIILAPDGGTPEINDSNTIATLLQFRAYLRSLGTPQRTKLITEVADSENIEIIRETGVRDFLVSNQFVSKIYAQVSEEQDVLHVYEDLFAEEGSEVYLKPVRLFIAPRREPISFGDLTVAGLMRNESVFGVRVMAEEGDASRNNGVYLNPPKSQMFTLGPEDCLITLAENET